MNAPKTVNLASAPPQSLRETNSPSAEKSNTATEVDPYESEIASCNSVHPTSVNSAPAANTTVSGSSVGLQNPGTSTSSPSTALTSAIKNGTSLAQSPTVGVVSPMMSHRTLRTPNGQSTDTGSQSDASTTSGSRDSDNVSVIFNPTEETKRQSRVSVKSDNDKKAPPVPVRTSSRLETTFDSNCCVTTTELPTCGESELSSIRPMDPIIPRVPPPYSAVVRNGKVCRQSTVVHRSSSKSGANSYVLPDSSTSEDSLDSVSTAIRCNPAAHASGYLSEGESLLAGGSNLPELSVADVSNGYMSEGGITVYARKMQARFREGLEAVRDSMRHRHHDYNDSRMFFDGSFARAAAMIRLENLITIDLIGSVQ
ncbi:unnamed protein product [Toxocara canis]|uniref:Uncharacterized protein n=1 Tax=Toxocara canis TaxID=6265 RepID=A0A3P7G495_TOXCA|nr:unnamed protein product [Toxocara canis]